MQPKVMQLMVLVLLQLMGLVLLQVNLVFGYFSTAHVLFSPFPQLRDAVKTKTNLTWDIVMFKHEPGLFL